MNQNASERAETLSLLWNKLNLIYEEFARQRGITYTHLYIWNAICREAECTQKKICMRTQLPKQTVNTIVRSFEKEGLVRLEPLARDQRIKGIVLTEAGKAYMETVIDPLIRAEHEAMGALPLEEQKAFIAIMSDYESRLRAKLLQAIE